MKKHFTLGYKGFPDSREQKGKIQRQLDKDFGKNFLNVQSVLLKGHDGGSVLYDVTIEGSKQDFKKFNKKLGF